ncbi:YebC/PmpR family DNA-binding transcriptional regulator [Paenalkalicoccus suaedae]|uniref:Probable transcriptional regulatory protein FLK61_28940 n=1 Tax=Paenalkalicoccus suaedae TaxID=2592382 RepID=A0A859FBM6_9BACI|nr:YebC/PmpR family DNA-binding transcriptional regulator [Paenalkalicoccus suaedae]QKS70763.1 YebC/PmpR family DNA-binding transcriptional regulator [Paenalkalicoccus suaedae]
MAGHSKWSNIKHRKGRQDAKRGKIFTKISKEIFQAVRQSGDNADTNAALRIALDKARQANMPNDNIDRTIKKALGNVEGITYEEVIYEGYAPYGVAVYVEALTENRNRTAAEVRLAFNKNGGNLGESGCVAFMFERKGVIVAEKTHDFDEEEFLLEILEAGALDAQSEEDVVEIYSDQEAFESVKEAANNQEELTILSAEVTMVPDTKMELSEEQLDEVMKLVDALFDSDDVQRVSHSAKL